MQVYNIYLWQDADVGVCIWRTSLLLFLHLCLCLVKRKQSRSACRHNGYMLLEKGRSLLCVVPGRSSGPVCLLVNLWGLWKSRFFFFFLIFRITCSNTQITQKGELAFIRVLINRNNLAWFIFYTICLFCAIYAAYAICAAYQHLPLTL